MAVLLNVRYPSRSPTPIILTYSPGFGGSTGAVPKTRLWPMYDRNRTSGVWCTRQTFRGARSVFRPSSAFYDRDMGNWSPHISMAVMKPKLISPTAETFLRNEARGWFRASSQAWTLAVNLSKHERYIGQAISSGPLQCALGVSVRTEPRPWGLNQPVREDTLLCARGSVTTTGMRSDSPTSVHVYNL